MPPRKKKNNELDRIAKLAKTLGMDVDQLFEEIPQTEIGEAAVLRHSIEAESVLFYIHTRGRDFEAKLCACCKMPFLHTYRAVAYCSDDCRAEALARYNIVWNASRRSDDLRWNFKNKGYVPKVIGAAATQALIETGNIHHEFPQEEVYETDEEIFDLPIQGIPEGSKGPVDDVERQERLQEEFETFMNERNS
jgi:hypothetical protein